jgi:DNA segregation ATPase FtsK/SpoIIIE, S-DNA-T family
MVPLVMAGVLYKLTNNISTVAFAALSPAMIFGTWWQSRKNAEKKFARDTAEFQSDVAALEHDVNQEQTTEIAARCLQAPPTQALIPLALARRSDLWIRGIDDNDFLLVRVGQGDQDSVVGIEIPDGGDRQLRSAIETLPSRYGIVANVPVEADLRLGGIGFSGKAQNRNQAVNSFLTQLTALHSPAELSIAAMFSEEEAQRWEWLKWLPHTHFPLSPLDGEHLAATPAACADLLRRLGETAQGRYRPDETGTPTFPSWLVVLVDERAHIDRPSLDALLKSGTTTGITFVWVSEKPDELPRLCRYVVDVDPVNPVVAFTVAGSGNVQRGIRADLLESTEAQNYARKLSPVQDISARTASELDLPPVVLLSELLGGDGVLSNPELIHDRWRGIAEKHRTLNTPIGQSPGSDYSVDVVRQGPHGFLIGTTGSGKSEMLRTLLVSLAATYGPERVNFLLIDFKGGAALKPFLSLPHTIGLVTNLSEGDSNADDKLEAKIKRTVIWLRAELQRRMAVLAAHDLTDIDQLERALYGPESSKSPAPKAAVSSPKTVMISHDPNGESLRGGNLEAPTGAEHDVATGEEPDDSGLPTLPRLLIVADEFAVLTARAGGDEVIDEIIGIARLGRSLGIHLLLSTQRATGVINENIKANTNLRIALRVQDTNESIEVIGSTDAALISQLTPGRAFVSVGKDDRTQVQTASSTGHTSVLRLVPKVNAKPFTFIGAKPQTQAAPELPTGPGDNDLTQLINTVSAAARKWPIPQPNTHWVEPPAPIVALHDLARFAGVDTDGHPELGTKAANPFRVTLGVLDDPLTQQVRPATIDLHADGHLLIFGASGSGKTVLLRTAAAAMAQQVDPTELRIIGLDCSGRGLASLVELPHVAGVVTMDDTEMVYRLLRELRDTITRRTKRFAHANVADLAEYRQKFPTGADRHLVVVLVDGIANFNEHFDKIDSGVVERLVGLLLDGRAAGVHFLITAQRNGGLPFGLGAAISERITLRLSTPDEYANADIKVADIPIEPPPGFGSYQKLAFQAAMVVDPVEALHLTTAALAYDEKAYDLIAKGARSGESQVAAMKALGDQLRQRSTNVAEPLLRLPEHLDRGFLDGPLGVWEAALGQSDSTHGRAILRLAETHCVITGPPRAGKSSTVSQVAASLATSVPGLRSVLIAARKSPATVHPGWSAVATTDATASELLQKLLDELNPVDAVGNPVTLDFETLTPTVVCLDDFGDLGVLTRMGFDSLFREAKAGAPFRFVVAATAKALFEIYDGASREIRGYRTGLLLQPDTDYDGELLTTRLPRQLWRKFPQGRGYLIQSDTADLIQVVAPGSAPE